MVKSSDSHFHVSDFLNGLFLGGLLGASYVYFFHHPKGQKLFQKILDNKEDLWQKIKEELEKEKSQDTRKINRNLNRLKTTGRQKIATFLSSRSVLSKKPSLKE
ncbi:MAG: hypothetical protein GXP43_00830 [bacterium]|nr:hypothetical protein [bacterium]